MDHSPDDTPHLTDRRVQELLDGLVAGGLTPPDEAEAKRVAISIFGRVDGLELLREMVAEEGMTSMLLERMYAENGAKGPTVRPRDVDAPWSAARVRAPHPWPLRKNWYGSARRAAALFLVAGGVTALGVHLARPEKSRAATPVVIATLPGQHTTIGLPDGSRATLAPNTRVTYTISPERGPRDISLDGEAYFQVRHNEARPFRVRTASAVVQDLGTEFLVREYSLDRRARVAVRSGSVAISAKASDGLPATGLRAGQAVDVDSCGRVVRLTGDTASYWSWTDGRLVFNATPLSEVLTRLSHWYGVEFRMTDSTLASQYFTGAFDAESLPQVLEILGPLVHASFEQQGKLVIVTPRPGRR